MKRKSMNKAAAKLGRRGGVKRWQSFSSEDRSAHARMMVAVRQRRKQSKRKRNNR